MSNRTEHFDFDLCSGVARVDVVAFVVVNDAAVVVAVLHAFDDADDAIVVVIVIVVVVIGDADVVAAAATSVDVFVVAWYAFGDVRHSEPIAIDFE